MVCAACDLVVWLCVVCGLSCVMVSLVHIRMMDESRDVGGSVRACRSVVLAAMLVVVVGGL